MIHELIYTSAPEGLKPGSQGFCTVAQSSGIPSNLAMRLETLSAYRPLFPPLDPRNPVMCMHLTLNLGGKLFHILSRIADAGTDYTQRSNKIGHHFLFENEDCRQDGPAAFFSIPNLFSTTWNRKPCVLPLRSAFPPLINPPLSGAWERLTGDRGWANVLAETVLTERPVSILFEPGTDVLPLFAEAIARLPNEQRWKATFSSYYNKLPPGIGCQWKGIVIGSPEAATAAAGDALVLDLTKPLGKAPAVTKTFSTPPKPPKPVPQEPARKEPVPQEPAPVEPENVGVYEITEIAEFPTDLQSESTDDICETEPQRRLPTISLSPLLLAALLFLAFLLGIGVGVWGTARFGSTPQTTVDKVENAPPI